MTRLVTLVSGLALVAGPATAATVDVYAAARVPGKATIVIRHQVQGCHSWSLNGGAYRVGLTARIARGGTITVVNSDLMPQELFQKGGPAVRLLGNPAMGHMRASAKVSFPRSGVYRFGTKAGADYFDGLETIGEDNLLSLTVKVS